VAVGSTDVEQSLVAAFVAVADNLVALSKRVTALEARVTALEAILIPQPKPNPFSAAFSSLFGGG
jgi:hypothetical protein